VLTHARPFFFGPMSRPATLIERIIFGRILRQTGRLLATSLALASFLHGAFVLVRFFRLCGVSPGVSP